MMITILKLREAVAALSRKGINHDLDLELIKKLLEKYRGYKKALCVEYFIEKLGCQPNLISEICHTHYKYVKMLCSRRN